MLGSPILYLKGMRILMFQLSGFYCNALRFHLFWGESVESRETLRWCHSPRSGGDHGSRDEGHAVFELCFCCVRLVCVCVTVSVSLCVCVCVCAFLCLCVCVCRV